MICEGRGGTQTRGLHCFNSLIHFICVPNHGCAPNSALQKPIAWLHSRVMSALPEILNHNATFVASKEYEEFLTSPLPNKRLVVITCMDTRLVELLPKAMGIRNGDVKMIKNAGAVVSHPFGSVMRSVLVAVYQLGADEIVVVGHHGCGMTGLSADDVLSNARQRGIAPEVLSELDHAGVNFQQWLSGFESPENGVRASVDLIRNHPLLPKDVLVHGLIIHPSTGQLDVVTIDGTVKSAPD
jgi:carbonic anhydrase